MNSILLLVPTQETAAYAEKELLPHFPEVIVAQCHPRDAVRTVAAHRNKNIGIVVCRGGMTHLVRAAKIDLPIVDIQVTSFDIIRAINKAKAHGKNIAVLAHANMVMGIDFLASSTGCEVRQYAISYNQDYEKAVLSAINDGAEVIICGALSGEVAKRYNMPYAMLEYGRESLLQAAREARQILEALEVETAKRRLIDTIVESSNDGIITVNDAQKITEMNSVAEKLLGRNKKALLDKKLASVIPQLAQTASGAGNPGQTLVTLKENTLICESKPIRYKDKTYGVVFTLRKTSSIQKMEAMIRQELYARGHVARYRFSDIIGESPAVREAVAAAKDYAATNSSVLILGETGTGKEIFAQSIHNAGGRAGGPFVAINCAAIPTHLLESELFGYVGGAFTGANKEGKPGLLEIAHGGTIFLDELAEMDYSNQGRLLRFYQEHSVIRLGSYRVIPVDVRIVAATNKNLEALVAENKFRDDLYHRLNVLRLELPPLRCRKGDITLYARSFLRQFATESGKELRLSRDAEGVLEEYAWPGNVRECRNIMERVAARTPSGTISGAMLRAMLHAPSGPALAPPSRALRQKREILSALEQAAGNHSEAAKALNVSRSTLYRRMQRLDIAY